MSASISGAGVFTNLFISILLGQLRAQPSIVSPGCKVWTYLLEELIMPGHVLFGQWLPMSEWTCVLWAVYPPKLTQWLESADLSEQEKHKVKLYQCLLSPSAGVTFRWPLFLCLWLSQTQGKWPGWCQVLWPYREGLVDWINKYMIPDYNLKSFKGLGAHSQKTEREDTAWLLSGVRSQTLLRGLSREELCGCPCRVLLGLSRPLPCSDPAGTVAGAYPNG